jgi:hypothetical protein
VVILERFTKPPSRFTGPWVRIPPSPPSTAVAAAKADFASLLCGRTSADKSAVVNDLETSPSGMAAGC